MNASITINLDGGAFAHDPGLEIALILRGLAKALEGGDYLAARTLRDTNGNRVGDYTVD